MELRLITTTTETGTRFTIVDSDGKCHGEAESIGGLFPWLEHYYAAHVARQGGGDNA